MGEGSRAHLSTQLSCPPSFCTPPTFASLWNPLGLPCFIPQPALPQSLMASLSLLASSSLYFHLPVLPPNSYWVQTPRP